MGVFLVIIGMILGGHLADEGKGAGKWQPALLKSIVSLRAGAPNEQPCPAGVEANF